MNKHSKHRCDLKGAKQQIFTMVRLSQLAGQQFFLAATLDNRIFILKVQGAQLLVHSAIKTSFLVCCVFLGVHSNRLYLGDVSGSITRHQFPSLTSKAQRYDQTKSPRPQLICVYEKGKNLWVWNINSEVKVLSASNLKEKQSEYIGRQITAGCWGLNPISENTIGIVAFSNDSVPYIFDCQSIKQIKQNLHFQDEIHESGKELHENTQVVEQLDFQSKGDHSFVVAGSCQRFSETKIADFVTLYEIAEDNSGEVSRYYLEPYLKYKLKESIQHLSIQFPEVVITSESRIYFINVERRNKREINNKGFIWTFLLEDSENMSKFLLAKGFSLQKPDQKIGSAKIYTFCQKIT